MTNLFLIAATAQQLLSQATAFIQQEGVVVFQCVLFKLSMWLFANECDRDELVRSTRIIYG